MEPHKGISVKFSKILQAIKSDPVLKAEWEQFQEYEASQAKLFAKVPPEPKFTEEQLDAYLFGTCDDATRKQIEDDYEQTVHAYQMDQQVTQSEPSVVQSDVLPKDTPQEPTHQELLPETIPQYDEVLLCGCRSTSPDSTNKPAVSVPLAEPQDYLDITLPEATIFIRKYPDNKYEVTLNKCLGKKIELEPLSGQLYEKRIIRGICVFQNIPAGEYTFILSKEDGQKIVLASKIKLP